MAEVAKDRAVRKSRKSMQRPRAGVGGELEVVNSQDSSTTGRSTYANLFLIEQKRKYTEDNSCCVSHCQGKYLQRTPRSWVRI